MARRIFYDGLNLSLQHGTGVATYCRMLATIARSLQHEIGIVYSSPIPPQKDRQLREISFFDPDNAIRNRSFKATLERWVDNALPFGKIEPTRVDFSGLVVRDQFKRRLPAQDYAFMARNLFERAARHFFVWQKFATLGFDQRPDIFHCTYPLPLKAKGALNIYTIHDLVPLRLPFTTLDDKRYILRLLKKIAATADHIVTVSENSRRDIIELLGVEERRVTNTYQSVEFPPEYVSQSQDVIAERLAGSYGLDYQKYLLFFGALEPKKNVDRLIEAYLTSGVNLPLVLVAGGGWQNEWTLKAIAAHDVKPFPAVPGMIKRRIYPFDYVNVATLVTLIMGARAVLMPSLYEGFGLPVLESMVLGTPVITSRASSLPEVAGDAALLVDPYEAADIARAIRMISEDDGLREDLTRRGRAQAARFGVGQYQDRLKSLYDSLA